MNFKKEKIIRFIKYFNIADCVCSILCVGLWFVCMNTPTKPLHIPPNDASVTYPRASSQVFMRNTLEYLVLPGFIGIIIILFPFTYYFPKIFICFSFFTAIWVEIASVAAANAITCIFKGYVGFPRPDTFTVCGQNTQYENCTAKKKDKQFISWPSTHATTSMSGCTYMALFIQRTVRDKYRVLFIQLIPLLFVVLGIYVGATRIRDFKHHPDDVTAGLLIGFIVPVILYIGAEKRIFPKKEEPNMSNDYNTPVTSDVLMDQ